jgi:hypothetical protein
MMTCKKYCLNAIRCYVHPTMRMIDCVKRALIVLHHHYAATKSTIPWSYLLLLCISLRFPERALANVLVHAPVDLHNNGRPLAQEPRKEPLHNSVAPVRRAREGNVLCASRPTNFAQCSLDELLRVRNESRWLADLGHCGGDEM